MLNLYDLVLVIASALHQVLSASMFISKLVSPQELAEPVNPEIGRCRHSQPHIPTAPKAA
jgi:hypothetical protein